MYEIDINDPVFKVFDDLDSYEAFNEFITRQKQLRVNQDIIGKESDYKRLEYVLLNRNNPSFYVKNNSDENSQ